MHYLVSEGNIYSAKNCRSAEPKLKKIFMVYDPLLSVNEKWPSESFMGAVVARLCTYITGLFPVEFVSQRTFHDFCPFA